MLGATLTSVHRSCQGVLLNFQPVLLLLSYLDQVYAFRPWPGVCWRDEMSDSCCQPMLPRIFRHREPFLTDCPDPLPAGDSWIIIKLAEAAQVDKPTSPLPTFWHSYPPVSRWNTQRKLLHWHRRVLMMKLVWFGVRCGFGVCFQKFGYHVLYMYFLDASFNH
jgi:hypothetical protein